MSFPNRAPMQALACASLLVLAVGCSGEEFEPDIYPPDEESERLVEDHAEWLEGSDRIALTLWFDSGCSQEVNPLELMSPTELRVSTFVPPEVVACTLAVTSYTYELDAPEGTSRVATVEIFADHRSPIALEPPH